MNQAVVPPSIQSLGDAAAWIADAVQNGTDPNGLAEQLGMVAWTFDPILANSGNTQANSKLVAVWLRKGTTISKMAVLVGSAGTGMTHAQLGIYDAGLNLVASTPDSPTAFNGTTGYIELSLSTPYVVPASGLYYFASAFATGTTLPSVANFISGGVTGQFQMPGGIYRGIHAQVQGTLPTPPVSQGAFSNVPFICAR